MQHCGPAPCISNAADVTERRRMEEILQQRQRLQAVGTIAGGVAHNFNNLLTNILGNLDLAAKHGVDPVRLSGYLDTARAAAERGADLTWQLLAFAGHQLLQPQPVELSGQLRGIAKLVAESHPTPRPVALAAGQARQARRYRGGGSCHRH
jgi:signal transduction histidine kinase